MRGNQPGSVTHAGSASRVGELRAQGAQRAHGLFRDLERQEAARRASGSNLVPAARDGSTGAGAQGARISEAEAERRAAELLDDRGGPDDISKDEAYAIGRMLAEQARTDPAAAAAVAEEVLDELADTDTPDNVAQGFVDNLTDADLAAVANSENGVAILTRMRDHLLRGDVAGAERESARRIDRAVTDSLFSSSAEPKTFVPLDPNVDDVGVDPTAIEAAQSTGDERDFLYNVHEHQNDPEWLNSYYRALGSEQVAEHLDNVLDTPLMGEEAAKVVIDSFALLEENGLFTQGGMNDLTGAFVARNSDFNDPGQELSLVGFSRVFSQSNSQDLKNMFFNSASDISTADAGVPPSDVKETLAAGAFEVLSTTSEANQVRMMTQLNERDADALDRLVKNGLLGSEVYAFGGEHTDFGHVSEVIASVANAEVGGG